jgi:hypothetical protein
MNIPEYFLKAVLPYKIMSFYNTVLEEMNKNVHGEDDEEL